MEYNCDICKNKIEGEAFSNSYFSLQKPICDPCLKIHKEKILLSKVPAHYKDARLQHCAGNFKGDESLFLWSKTPGTGKTYLAWAFYINKRLQPKDNGAEFSTFGRLQLLLRDAMNKEAQSEIDIVDFYSNVDLCVLDDVGGLRQGQASDYSLNTIFEILDTRYSNNRQTIVTSNKSISELSKMFDDRIASRLAEMCRIIEMGGQDRRLKGGK